MKTIALAVMLSASWVLQAQSSTPVVSTPPVAAPVQPLTPMKPQGRIESAVAVADPDFGIHAKALGLERRVEMLQWRKLDTSAPAHYEQAWLAERVDSSSYDAAHRNTGDLPFNGARWWSTDSKLDGHPVSTEVLAALSAWTPLKPDLSQLPANLAVSFQPDGDWLSTSQDPMHLQNGDVRVRWRVIEHASAPAGTVLIAGHWTIPAINPLATPPAPAVPPRAITAPSTDAHAWMQHAFGNYLTWLIAAGILLALIILLVKRRR